MLTWSVSGTRNEMRYMYVPAGKRTIDFRAFKPFYMNADAGKADCNAQKGKASTTSTYCSKWQQKEKRKTNYPVLCKFRFLLKSFLIHKERGDLCVFSF